jgi:arylsulfatase
MSPSRTVLPALLLALSVLAGCRPSSETRGPIVLITFDSLRADVVEALRGEPGLTPRLDALAQEADWSGRAIASSSWEGSAMASLMTGLRPWQHQVLHAGRARLSPDLVTLAEALAGSGYESAGFYSGPWYTHAFGFDQGFASYQHYGRGERGLDRLRRLRGGRELIWIHLPAPEAPYVLREELLPRLGRVPPLPRKVTPLQLEPYFDPAVELPTPRRRRLWALYRLNVAWADEQLGRLLDALRESGQWDRTLLVVTSNHGEEFGEKGQILHGGNLGRQLIEVPLVVKLPAGFGRHLRVPRGEHVAVARVWATLVEAAGGQAPPAVAPSLFRAAPAGVLSELYLTNGTNRFSWVEGDDQLLWESRFAPSEPEYYLARLRSRSGPNSPIRLAENPKVVFTRLRDAFDVAPPLTGLARPVLTLERWGERGSVPVADPRRTAEMARRLAAAWVEFVPEERPPGEEAAEWGLPPRRARPAGSAGAAAGTGAGPGAPASPSPSPPAPGVSPDVSSVGDADGGGGGHRRRHPRHGKQGRRHGRGPRGPGAREGAAPD